jgi:hypothetical protein
VNWSSGRSGIFTAELSGLTSGQPCSVAVRSFNVIGEEPNTAVLMVTPDGTGPAVVDLLAAVPTNQEP